MKFLIAILMIEFLLSHNILSQITDSTEIHTEETLNEILEESFTEEDNSDIYNSIEELLLNPIDLNSADTFELQKIPGITPNAAEIILSYRERFGPFFSVNELYAMRELDKELIDKIIPFLMIDKNSFYSDSVSVNDPTFSEKSIPSELDLQFRSRYGNDLQTRKGFEEGIYIGTKLRAYNRLILKYSKQVQAGIILDKDAGERDLNDFNSFHLNVKDLSIIDNLVVGDYVLEFGQGLMVWSPYSFSKGSDAIFPVKRKGKTIKPYTSSFEYDFMRGGAFTIKYSDLFLTAFYSAKKIDANVDSVTNKITSTPETGLHLTINDLNKKNRVKENIIGGRISYKYQNYLNVGLSAYNSKFSNEFEPSNIYDLAGSQFRYYSFDYDLNINQLNFFGEVVYNEKSVASLNGLIISPIKNFILTLSIRNYPANYINLHGFGFGEQSGKTSNEFGIYYGIKWSGGFGLVNIYYDQFRFPYATTENPVPSSGDEIYLSFSKRIFSKTDLLLRFKSEKKDVAENLEEVKSVLRRIRSSYRAELVYDVSNSLRMKSRIEYNTFDISEADRNERGFLVLQDARFALTKTFQLYGRVIFFETDSFNSAVYEFENDLAGVLTNLAMYDKGIRWYIMARYKPFNLITLSMKYSETYKPDAKTLGSGNNLLNNNVDNRISFQIDINY